ncbi:MAG: HU family DNA-binding protein [Candidatus Uhrbacteria bacterium]
MNKAELALKISDKLNIPKKTAEEFIEVFEEIVTKTLMADNEVTIAGFGTFSAKIRAGRAGVNPQNPTEKIQIPSVRVPKFKAGKSLKDALKAKVAAPVTPVA